MNKILVFTVEAKPDHPCPFISLYRSEINIKDDMLISACANPHGR